MSSAGPGKTIRRRAPGCDSARAGRYINLSFLQRVYLVWMFRHFCNTATTGPQIAPTKNDRPSVHVACFVSPQPHNGREQAPIVGTVERRPLVLVDEPPDRRPVVAFAESAFQALFVRSRLIQTRVIVRLSRLAHNVRSGTLRQTARGHTYFRSCFLARDSKGLVQTELKDRFPGNCPLLALGEQLGSLHRRGRQQTHS